MRSHFLRSPEVSTKRPACIQAHQKVRSRRVIQDKFGEINRPLLARSRTRVRNSFNRPRRSPDFRQTSEARRTEEVKPSRSSLGSLVVFQAASQNRVHIWLVSKLLVRARRLPT